MITASDIKNTNQNVRSVVTRLCTSLYSALNSQKTTEFYDEQLVNQTLLASNKLGVTHLVERWFNNSDRYKINLEELINSRVQDKNISKLLRTGDSYWSKYGLTSEPTIETLHHHMICYALADKLYSAMVNGVDNQKIHACLYESGARCLVNHVNDAFSSFFASGSTLSSWLSEKSPNAATLYSEIESKHSCSAQDAVTYVPPFNSNSGDSSEITQSDRVETISTGSSKKTWDRHEYTRFSETHSQHTNNTSTLHTNMMMSDLSETYLGHYDNVRVANNFDKIQSSPEYVNDMLDLLTYQDVGFDYTIDDTINILLQNRFLYNQIGDRVLDTDKFTVAPTRIQ